MICINEITNYTTVLPENKYYFDSNVWIFLNNPYPGSVSRSELRRQEPYSALFELVSAVKATIYINFATVKEIADYIISEKFKRFKNLTGLNDFKNDFRKHKHYEEALCSFQNTINEILEFAVFVNNFEFDLLDFVQNYRIIKDIDLNDLYFLDYCHNNDYIFVSDDFDCSSYNKKVQILTANKRILGNFSS